MRPTDTPPTEFAQTSPRELYPVADIRFVITEVSKLTTQVERLISDVKDLNAKVNPGQIERLVEDVKTVSAKVDEVQHTVSYMKGALKVVGIFAGGVIAIAGLVFAALRLFPVQPAPQQPIQPPAAVAPSTSITPPAPKAGPTS